MKRDIAPIVISIGIVAAIFGGLHACAESRRRDFRRDCQRRGAVIVEALAADGTLALVCQPPEVDGGIVPIPSRGWPSMPRHR